MKKMRRILCWLTAAVMALGLAPAACAEEKAAEPARFSIETEESSGWTAEGYEKEWDEQVQTFRKEGLAAPITEEEILSADPDASVERQNGRVFMIRSKAGLGTAEGIPGAYVTAYRLIGLLGGKGDMELRLWSVLKVGDIKVYVFQHVFEGLTVVGSTLKMVADKDGRVTATFSSLSAGNPEATGTEQITARQAEETVRKTLQEEGKQDTVLPENTFLAVLPAAFDIDSEESLPDRLVWVVFSENPVFAEGKGTDLPYLAHYVDMAGTYLHAVPVSIPGDRAARSGYAAEHAFDGMERQIWAGTKEGEDGKKIDFSVPVMKDPKSGLWYLGDPERMIAVGEFEPMIYKDPRETVLLTSETIDGWEVRDLQAYQHMIMIWDFYDALGWKGPDGTGTPLLMLRNMCQKNGEAIENACYAGKIDGWQTFAYGGEANLTAAVDVMSHEYTHCVTTSTMNSNLYEEDYGAINEAMSDIVGNISEMMLGATEDKNWFLGENTGNPFRSMAEPHLYNQPEYVWDVFYAPGTDRPNDINDRGGVHVNSSLLNMVAAKLCLEGGMTLEEALRLWLTAASVLTPRTDYYQMAYLLPWALEASGNGQYMEHLRRLIGETRMTEENLPETLAEGQQIVTLQLPDNEVFRDPYWVMMAIQINTDTVKDWVRAAGDLLMAAVFGREIEGSVLMRLLTEAGLLDPEHPEATEQADSNLVLARILSSLYSEHMSWTTSEDHRQIKAVMNQHATIYTLLNIDPETTRIRSAAILLGDEWVEVTPIFAEPEEKEEGQSPLSGDNLGLLLKAAKLLPSLLKKQDPAVKWIELPATGLENVGLLPLSRSEGEKQE